MIIEDAGLYGYAHFTHGCFPAILDEAGFVDVSVSDLTDNVVPMLRRFHRIAVVPYRILDRLGRTGGLVNAKAAIHGYEMRDHFGYNLITARKPG